MWYTAFWRDIIPASEQTGQHSPSGVTVWEHVGGWHIVSSQSTLPFKQRQVVHGSGDHTARLYMVIPLTRQWPCLPRREAGAPSIPCGVASTREGRWVQREAELTESHSSGILCAFTRGVHRPQRCDPRAASACSALSLLVTWLWATPPVLSLSL